MDSEPFQAGSRTDTPEGAAAVVDDLVDLMVGGMLPFPYKHNYLRPPKEYLKNLQRNTHVLVSDDPYISRMRKARGRASVRSAIANTPWGFDRRELSFIVGDRAYDDIDQITNHFTETARMAANVRGSPSPLVA